MPSRQREREVERQRRIRQAQRREQARRRAQRRRAILGAVVAAALVVGVGALLLRPAGKRTTPTATASPTPGTPAPTASPSPFPPLPAGADSRLATKPVVRVPRAAPTKLGVRELIVGRGPAATAGRQLTVNYVGVGYPSGKEFDSSWRRRQPLTFAVGRGQVIPGWDRGLVGMRVGGRRQLVIPATLAYGASGQPPAIQPNEPLVFVVDLLGVK